MPTPTVRWWAALAAPILLVALGAPARAGDATGAFAPYEDVLQVVADLTWHLRDDVYRFPPPKDPTGHGVYELCLERLRNWEKRYPGRLRDVTAYARAESLDRLGEYRAAADLYRQVAALPSPLAGPAREAAGRSAAFAEADALPETGADIEATLTALRTKLDAWGKLVVRWGATPYEALARVEEERLERRAAETVVVHRRMIADGDQAAERGLRFMIEKHAESKALPEHVLRLADFYADLARDYVAAHERPLAFDQEEFARRADRALETYRKVSTWDGTPEKPEASARFAAFDAYKTTILGRYR